ncbi:MAG: helix-turn-helix domain-containing protein [Candidatus Promineifilaceae bacterium]|jgi:excisionase family DNA binding protein
MSDLPVSSSWLSLSGAAERLGVHPTTLRRWADNGDINVMFTPGGHRRFLVSDLEAFAAERRVLMGNNQAAAEWADRALQNTRQELVTQGDQRWVSTLDNGTRDDNRRLGQQLLGLTMQYISATDEELPAMRAQAQEIGRQYGEMAHHAGLPITEALKATLFFRDLLMETALRLPENLPLKPEANVRLTRKISQLMNTVQLEIAEVYDDNDTDIVYRG